MNLGFPCPPLPQGFVPRCLYQTATAPFPGTSIVTEDFSQQNPDQYSLCAFLGGITLGDLCLPCEGARHFIGSSSQDWCLKELSDGYSRVICCNPELPTGPGTPYQNNGGIYFAFAGAYQTQGYFSTMRSGPQGFGVQFQKAMSRFKVNCMAEDQTLPCAIRLRAGMSYNPADPNFTRDYGVIWRATVAQLLEYPGTLTPAEYEAQNIIPNIGIEFPLYLRGVWLYWELAIGNLADPTDLTSEFLPATGGASRFSSVYQTVREISEYVK